MIRLAPNVSTSSPHPCAHPSPMSKRDFVVLVTDTENPWRSALVTVQATDKHDAKLKARGHLAVTQMDHWSVTHVTEAAA